MNRIRDIITSLLILMTAFLGACARQQVDAETASESLLASRVDSLVAPLVSAHEFSGAVVLMRRGEVVYRRGFGMANHAAGVPFTPDTPSDGGSVAKTFTAAGVWWLAAEGRLDLDAPVVRYVPEHPHAQTTVRHLIAHSNGLPPYYGFFDPYFAADEVRTTTALLRIVSLHAPEPAFVPGTRFEYSNLGFDVAALVIERVSGQSYEAFVRARFFEPLGMQASFGRPARFADWRGVRTMGYRWSDGAWTTNDVLDMEAFLGASNLYFSAADLARWGSANATGSALPAAVVEAGQKHIDIGGGHSGITGLSWYCDDSQSRCHYTGDYNAFYSFVYWDRVNQVAVAFVSNSTMPWWTRIGLQRALVRAFESHPGAIDDSLAFARFDPKNRAVVAGSYSAQALGSITISADSDGLHFQAGSALRFGMFPVSEDVFYVPGLDYFVAFSGGQPPPTIHVRSMELDVVGRRL
ncbi:MAG: serine hydrolase domain-containing protein [Limisphaerales bacterium]